MINKKIVTLQKQGFTLIETLVAVLLLSIAIVGPMTIAQKGLQTALIAKDQSTAFNLAQDAVEFVRFARDTNCLVAGAGGCPAANWLSGNGSGTTIDLGNCISTSGTTACYVSSYDNTVSSCGAATCTTPINFDATKNAFTYISGTATIFTRTVQIIYNNACSAPCNPNEADVIVTISWSDPIVHTISVRESLYNWQ